MKINKPVAEEIKSNAKLDLNKEADDNIKLNDAPWYVNIIAILLNKRIITWRDFFVFSLALVVTGSLVAFYIFQNEKVKKIFVEDVGNDVRSKLIQGHRSFQWQWAGENWLGYITFNEVNGSLLANLDMNLIYKTQNQGLVKAKRMKTLDPGLVEIKDGKVFIKKMRVENFQYSNNDLTKPIETHISTMDFVLNQTTGFEGTVSYAKDGEDKAEGNIALVYHKWVP